MKYRKFKITGFWTALFVASVLALTSCGGQERGDSASAAMFNYPHSLAVDKNGNLYVVDNTPVIRKITSNGMVSTVVGQAGQIGIALGVLPGSVSFILGIAVDSNGVLYATSAGAILKIKLP